MANAILSETSNGWQALKQHCKRIFFLKGLLLSELFFGEWSRRRRRIDKGNLLKRHPFLIVSTTTRFYPRDMIKKQKSQRSSCLSESNWNRKTGASRLLLDFLQHLLWENLTASVNFPNHQWTGIRYRKEISIRNIDCVTWNLTRMGSSNKDDIFPAGTVCLACNFLYNV